MGSLSIKGLFDNLIFNGIIFKQFHVNKCIEEKLNVNCVGNDALDHPTNYVTAQIYMLFLYFVPYIEGLYKNIDMYMYWQCLLP